MYYILFYYNLMYKKRKRRINEVKYLIQKKKSELI